MTTEEKAKAYNEALERAEGIIKYYKECNRDEASIEDLETIFPELKESEDERIRKEMLNVFKQLGKDTTICGRNYDYTKWIAWLEKQGETYTKKDVDDAYLKGVCDAKSELEKQGENKQILANSAKTCKKSQRMVSAEAKEALYDKPATIDIDKMVDDYANNEEFGKPLNSMIRAYRQGLKDAIGKVVLESAWSDEDDEMLDGIILRCEKYGHQEQINWLKSLKERIGG